MREYNYIFIDEAFAWTQQRTAEQVMIERTDMIGQLEEADRRMRASGLQRQWFAGADEAIFGVAGETNGTLR